MFDETLIYLTTTRGGHRVRDLEHDEQGRIVGMITGEDCQEFPFRWYANGAASAHGTSEYDLTWETT